MSCRRAFDVDLPAYLVDPQSAEWDDFRTHWPTCADCAAEMAAWTALQSQLGAGGHPDPEALLRWADGDDRLPSAERLALARHVESCRTCTDELRALARFDVAPQVDLRAAAAAAAPMSARIPAPAAAPARPSIVRRVLWNPAVAYALLLLALAPTVLQEHEKASAPVVRSEPAPVASPVVIADAEADRRPAEANRTAPAGGFAEGESRGAGAVAPAPPPPPPAAPTAQAPATKAAPKPEPSSERRRAVGSLERAPEPEATEQDETPILSIPLPDAARRAGVVELRLHDVANERELRERFPVHPDLATLSFELPPAWRDHTTYEIELRVPGKGVVARQKVTAR